MVLHILSNHLTASHTSSVNSGLTLTEDNDRLQSSIHLLDDALLNDGLCRTSLASSQLSLQVSNSLTVSSNLTILSLVVSTQLVDLSVQAINLSLVAQLLLLEVMRTVRVAELVVHTNANLSDGIPLVVNLAERISPYWRRLTHYNSRLDVELPSLVSTQVESEVQTSLSIQTRRSITVCVAVTTTNESDNLKSAGVTLITSKSIAQVEGTQQVNIDSVDESLLLHH